MNKTLTALFFAIPYSLSAMNGFLDVEATLDPVNTRYCSHIDISPSTAISYENGKAWLMSPHVALYFDGSMDISLASGLRHPTPYGFFGHHVFWALSQTGHGSFHQVGHCLDFLTPKIDYRINYYHPVTKVQQDSYFFYDSHRWAEAEALWKGNYFNLGCGPKYNFATKAVGFHARAVIPFMYFNLGASVAYDNRSKFSTYLSLSFSLYSSTRDSQLPDPIAYQPRVRYGKRPVPMVLKAQKPKEQSQEAAPLGVVKEDLPPVKPVVIEPIAIPEPIPTKLIDPPPPKVSDSWWNFFFSGKK